MASSEASFTARPLSVKYRNTGGGQASMLVECPGAEALQMRLMVGFLVLNCPRVDMVVVSERVG